MIIGRQRIRAQNRTRRAKACPHNHLVSLFGPFFRIFSNFPCKYARYSLRKLLELRKIVLKNRDQSIIGARPSFNLLKWPLLSLMCFVLSCKPGQALVDANTVVAEIGQSNIVQGRFAIALVRSGIFEAIEAEPKLAMAQVVLDRLVKEELLLEGARCANIAPSADEIYREIVLDTREKDAGELLKMIHASNMTPVSYRELVIRNLTLELYLKARLSSISEPNESEIHELFEQKRSDLILPAQVRAKHILFDTMDVARYVLNKIKKRVISFEKAAKKHGKSPDSQSGGDLGWVSRGDLPEVFDSVFALGKNKLSEVLPSKFGFHLLQVVDKRASRQLKLADVKEDLKKELVAKREVNAVNNLVSDLKARFGVRVKKGALYSALAFLEENLSILGQWKLS